MKFALVEGEKTEAVKGVIGICPCCNSELIAKCGEVKINHWAHKGTRNCDIWWENETIWHRQWKGQFPKEWQEIVQFDSMGEKHIADVITDESWVIEFQYSHIKPDERRARNSFYRKLIWVIDGLRRKTDVTQFNKILQESSKAPIGNVNIRKITFPEKSRLLIEWLSCEVPVFFDFQEQSRLWLLFPVLAEGEAYLTSFSREEFIKIGNNRGLDELANEIIPNIRDMLIKHKHRLSNRSISNLLLRPKKRNHRNRF